MTAYMAETFEAVSLLNKGIETYIPSSGNFKTSDVLSLVGSDIKSTVTSVDGRHADDGVLYIKGTSVKFAGGSASQLTNKIQQKTPFHNHFTIKISDFVVAQSDHPDPYSDLCWRLPIQFISTKLIMA